ncbi:dipeptidase [Rhodococcus sp. WAY2]|uniref:dipeptidase n=1 Tax=Rhodococcus sp. WAY2 TaxID=2663121 RepID=UPI001320084A|nr:membrane dipeptidase [Rhodococcus sp. WAY2]QHE68095.1 renal dipeptidase family protein [Rhodococcus sp. WAY2]
MSAPGQYPLWEQHCCLPLTPSATIDELRRYRRPAGSYVSVNIGYSPQDRAASTAIAENFRAQAGGDIELVTRLDDVDAIRGAGGIALAFDLEDSAPLDGDLANVAHFHRLGTRSLLPTYNHANAAGCGCLDAHDTGLTGYGRDLVREMNRVGMTVDGSHCSIRTGLDLAAVTERPMIYSHSNLRRLWDHPRNITDDQARSCAETGGVIGINGVGIFLGVNGPDDHARRLSAMADHIEEAVDLVGPAHVGIGSDYSFDAADFVAEITNNAGSFSDAYTAWGPLQWVPPENVLTLDRVLRNRGFDEPSIEAVYGGNFARVAAAVWATGG